MLDFKLKVFLSASRSLSFTKAATENFISQPAVSKIIKQLELQIGHHLFERKGAKLELTRAGEILMGHLEQVSQTEKQLQFDLGLLSNEHKGVFTIGASTTIAQYVIPKLLLQFSNVYPNLEVKLLSGNTNEVEHAMLEKRVDLGVVEGVSHRSGLRYIPFMDDDLVVCCHKSNPIASRGDITLELLQNQPVLLRERGSGTLEVIEYALRSSGLRLSNLNVKLYLGSTESIKNALEAGTCIAIISRLAVRKELEVGSIKQLHIADISFRRELAFVTPVGGATGIADSFIQFVRINR